MMGAWVHPRSASITNAVVAFRFETNDYGDTGGVEVCAYGAAVTIA